MNEELPRLSPKAAEAFSRFARRANKGLLHSLDWEMLYRFVYVCRAMRVTLSEDDFYRLLRSEGFANAKQISVIFHSPERICTDEIVLNAMPNAAKLKAIQS